MPKFPEFSNRIKAVPNSIFESYKPQFRKLGNKLFPFHLGDTYKEPMFELPINESFLSTYKFQNRYCNTFGVAAFREALAQKVNEDNGFDINSGNIMVTNGAVNALNAAVFSIMNPGEEILILTPSWPFFMGVVKMAEGVIKEIPFYVEQYSNKNFNITKEFEKNISENTVAVYLNTPNNPSGKVLSFQQIEEIAHIVNKNKLWLISDEAYESFVYDSHIHFSIGNLPNVFKQTITIFSLAKTFMVAGYRLGYIVADESVLNMLNKSVVHQVYSAPSVLQYMMLEPVKNRHSWLPSLKKLYEEMRNSAYSALKIKADKPQGGYYFFLNLKPYLQKLNMQNYAELFEKILMKGVALTPGIEFGKEFEEYVRLCFTSVDKEKLLTGINILNDVLEN